LSEHALEVSILSPREGETLQAGSPMRLWAAASTGREDEELDISAGWELDGKQVANGLDAFIEAPEEGEHRLTLEVQGNKQPGRAEITFRTVRVQRKMS
jgi:hypothetical protein